MNVRPLGEEPVPEAVGPSHQAWHRVDPGTCGVLLAVFYAVFVRFYQAAGGMIGLSQEPPAGARWASYVAGLLVLVGGAACLVLTRPSLQVLRLPRVGRVPAPRAAMVCLCVVPTLAGALVAVGHGAGGGAAKLIDLAGLGVASIHSGGLVARTSETVWQVLFYQGWFLAMGVCLASCALRYLRGAHFSPRTVRVVAVAIGIGCACSVAVFVLSMLLHWNLDIGI